MFPVGFLIVPEINQIESVSEINIISGVGKKKHMAARKLDATTNATQLALLRNNIKWVVSQKQDEELRATVLKLFTISMTLTRYILPVIASSFGTKPPQFAHIASNIFTK